MLVKVVEIKDTATRCEIFQRLVYSSDMNGRALCADLPELGLLQGDRLDPCDTLQDVSKFELMLCRSIEIPLYVSLRVIDFGRSSLRSSLSAPGLRGSA